MARTKYYFDPESCNYKKVIVTKWDIFFNVIGYLSTTSVLAISFLLIYFTLYESPEVKYLKNRYTTCHNHYKSLNKKFESNEGSGGDGTYLYLSVTYTEGAGSTIAIFADHYQRVRCA